MTQLDQKTPWTYGYNPYRTNDGREIPCFEIVDCEGRRLAQTDEDTPAALQEADARLLAAAPQLLAAGRAVVEAWERGDLAAAVRALSAAVDDAAGAL